MRAFVLALPMLLTACAAQQRDRFNPYELNEQAVREIAAGRYVSAQILLERAALLAPHEKRIQGNLEALKAYRGGQTPDALPLPPVEPAPEPVADGEPKVPLWPGK